MKLATTWCSLSATFAQRFDWTNLFCVFVRKVKSFSRRFRIVCMFGDVALDKNKNKMRSQSPRNIQSLQYSYLLVTGASLPIYCLVPAPDLVSTNQHAVETCQGEVFIRRVRLEFGLTNSSRKNKLASQWTQKISTLFTSQLMATQSQLCPSRKLLSSCTAENIILYSLSCVLIELVEANCKTHSIFWRQQ